MKKEHWNKKWIAYKNIYIFWQILTYNWKRLSIYVNIEEVAFNDLWLSLLRALHDFTSKNASTVWSLGRSLVLMKVIQSRPST